MFTCHYLMYREVRQTALHNSFQTLLLVLTTLCDYNKRVAARDNQVVERKVITSTTDLHARTGSRVQRAQRTVHDARRRF
ncbi:hypothetical protein BaRGS_00034003, partial [Batillaria attramentaria]